ncbi:MAG: hypothetical protein E7672_05985 [Ruminococcaceae bacterium]|nr:hypothetical protein [Oscillospiraceae bacterium]
MKYYRRNPSSSTRLKRIMFRILFVVVAAFIILMLSVILGLHLKSKVDAAENNPDNSLDNPGLQISREDEEDGDTVNLNPDVFAGCVDLLTHQTTDDVVVSVNTAAETYDSITLSLTDLNGVLLYQSPALCDLLRIPYNDNSGKYELLTSAISAAKVENLRIIALFIPTRSVSSVSSAALIDGTVMAELAKLGVNEILIDLQDSSGLTYEEANRIRSYISECSKIVGSSCSIGVILSDVMFLNAENAKSVQMIAGAASYLAINFNSFGFDTPDDLYDSISSNIKSLLGTFSVYNMRVYIDSSERDYAAAELEACMDNVITNICFSTLYSSDELEFSENDIPRESDTSEPSETIPEDYYTNPYAGTSFSENNKETESPETAPSPQETDKPSESESSTRPWF